MRIIREKQSYVVLLAIIIIILFSLAPLNSIS